MPSTTSVLGTLVALAVIGAVTFLAYTKIVNGEAAVALYSTLIGGGGAGTLAVVAHQAGARSSK